LNGQLYLRDMYLLGILNRGRSQAPVENKNIDDIDSLEMTDPDREPIVYQHNNCKENQIVITHR